MCSPVCTTPGLWSRPHVQRGCLSSLAYPCFCSVSLKDFPPYWPPLGDVAVGFHPRPRLGPFRYPPLRCRGIALAGSGGRYVFSVDNCAGMRLPRAIGGASQLVSFIRRFTRPGGRPPCRGSVAVCDFKDLVSEAGGGIPARHKQTTPVWQVRQVRQVR